MRRAHFAVNSKRARWYYPVQYKDDEAIPAGEMIRSHASGASEPRFEESVLGM